MDFHRVVLQIFLVYIWYLKSSRKKAKAILYHDIYIPNNSPNSAYCFLISKHIEKKIKDTSLYDLKLCLDKDVFIFRGHL